MGRGPSKNSYLSLRALEILNRLEGMEPANGFLLLMIRNDERNRGGRGLERDEDRSRENNESIDMRQDFAPTWVSTLSLSPGGEEELTCRGRRGSQLRKLDQIRRNTGNQNYERSMRGRAYS